ncbi:MAG: acyl-CoA dehydrogenase family protein [Dehalococcoidia bacterium]
MADLSLSDEQQLLQRSARDFVERECPLADVRRINEDEGGFSWELWEKMAGLGWLGILIPTEHGGAGGSLTDAAALYEELGRGLLPGPYHSSAVVGATLLLQSGSVEQKTLLLPEIARGERIVALALTEPDYGWAAEHVQMTARASGGGFVLDGTKRFVPDAGAAGTLIVAARTTAGEWEEGVTLFLVERDAPGVSLRPMRGFSGEPLFDVTFNGVDVTRENVVGEVDDGWRALEPSLDVATALLCAYIAGATRRVYEMTLDYAQRRVQFGQAIARFQRVQDHLVDMLNHADAARWTAYEAVWKLETGRPDAREAVSVAKAVASEGFYQSCESAHHVHAGVGSDKAYGLYLYTQRSRALYHYLGDPAHHRRRIARLLFA